MRRFIGLLIAVALSAGFINTAGALVPIGVTSETTACPTSDAVGLLVGDVLSCLASEPQRGPASGVPGGRDPEKFELPPGEDYSGLYGPEPKPLPMPENCDTPVVGTYTQDQGVVTAVTEKGGRTIYTATYNTHLISGFWAGGRSVVVTDFWATQKGYTAFVGRELLEGTVAGRTGSMVNWNVGVIEPDGRIFGKVFSIGGTEGLANIRFRSNFTAMANKGGHLAAPSRMCFAD